jgi:glycosyltransferase involved in cell wall biosynthesis
VTTIPRITIPRITIPRITIPRITILRIARPTGFLTADVFESLFDRQFGSAFTVRRAAPTEWCDAILGPIDAPHRFDQAATRFADATREIDFFCPGFEAIPLAPYFVALRNHSRSRARLLFIAHAAAAYSAEWALLHPLLAPGDLIVAPSHSGARAIDALCPSLSAHTVVIHHPMAPLDVDQRSPRDRIVTLSRLQPNKLVHRQIDAMATVRRRRGRATPIMEIAGAESTSYTRTLEARIGRLGLADHVRLVGAVRGDAAKSQFLGRARLLINLSVTIEESFPKTPVEALGTGIPVVATAWDGLHETVGSCGALVPVTLGAAGGDYPDGSADAIADGIEQQLDDPPPPDRCRAHAAQFAPEISVPRYRATLAASLDQRARPPELPAPGIPAAPATGLLRESAAAHYGWTEMFALYADSCAAIRAGWVDRAVDPPPGLALRASIQASVEKPLVRLYAGLPPAPAALRSDAVTAYERAGEFERAFAACAATLDAEPAGEYEADRIRRLARLARQLGRPGRALPWVAAWLAQFPDAPDSGPVWLDRSLGADAAESDTALDRARELLVSSIVVEKVAAVLAARRVTHAFA